MGRSLSRALILLEGVVLLMIVLMLVLVLTFGFQF